MNVANNSSKKCESAISDSPAGLLINSRVTIPQSELVVRATRSSGAGGQHVNKTASRIELTWNVNTSQALSDAQRIRLLQTLSSRLTTDGELRIVASDTRSQYQNREIAEARLADILRQALVVPKIRKPTKPSTGQKQARLHTKRRQGEKKRDRRRTGEDD